MSVSVVLLCSTAGIAVFLEIAIERDHQIIEFLAHFINVTLKLLGCRTEVILRLDK